MIEPDYYPLKQAAEILLICSEDTLIHLGAMGKLPIYILTMKYFVEGHQMKPGSESVTFSPGGTINRLAKLWRGCLLEFEAGNNETRVSIEPEYFYNDKGQQIGEHRYQLKRKDMVYPSMDMLRDAQRKGVDIDKIYPPPILIKDCNLVILHDDLICLQESEPQSLAIKRKKLIPLQRETNEGLLLIYELLDSKGIKYLDELSALTAWGLIVEGEFKSDLIKSISDTKKSIMLNGGGLLAKADFLEKYRKRFKDE